MWYELPRSERPILESFGREPRLYGLDEPWRVVFGNSGLELDLVRRNGLEERNFHFSPEGRWSPGLFRTKYAKMLGAGFYGLWLWLSQPPMGHEAMAKKFVDVNTVTNDTLALAMARLFERWGHGDLVWVAPTGHGLGKRIGINLEGFKALGKDDLLVGKLKGYDEAADKLKVVG